VRIITGVGDVVNVQPEVDEVDDDAVGVDVDVGIVDVGPDDPVLWKHSNNPNSSRTAKRPLLITYEHTQHSKAGRSYKRR
jgi:hypothetical protein